MGQCNSEQRKQEQGGNGEKGADERLHTGMRHLCDTPEEGRDGIKTPAQGPTRTPNAELWWLRRARKSVSLKYCFDKYAISLWNSNLQLFSWHGHLCSTTTGHRLRVNSNCISDLGRGGCQWEVYEQYAPALMWLEPDGFSCTVHNKKQTTTTKVKSTNKSLIHLQLEQSEQGASFADLVPDLPRQRILQPRLAPQEGLARTSPGPDHFPAGTSPPPGKELPDPHHFPVHTSQTPAEDSPARFPRGTAAPQVGQRGDAPLPAVGP